MKRKFELSSNLKRLKKMEHFFRNVPLLPFSLNPVAREKEQSHGLEAVDNAVRVTISMKGREYFSQLQGRVC